MRDTLQELPGVTQVKINAAMKTATATIDPKKFDTFKARNALREVKFPATRVDGPILPSKQSK